MQRLHYVCGAQLMIQFCFVWCFLSEPDEKKCQTGTSPSSTQCRFTLVLEPQDIIKFHSIIFSESADKRDKNVNKWAHTHIRNCFRQISNTHQTLAIRLKWLPSIERRLARMSLCPCAHCTQWHHNEWKRRRKKPSSNFSWFEVIAKSTRPQPNAKRTESRKNINNERNETN